MAFAFKPAVRQQRKARIGLVGPSGSGKTYTALTIAKGFGGRVALIDTENYSSTLYADDFKFDVLNLTTFSPQTYVQAIRAAEQAGYDVLIIDSLSHAWSGKDGALEQVDKAAARTRGNTFAAWREVTPMHNEMVDAIIRADMHVIVTMRAKTEYVVDKDESTGRTAPRKVGLAPIQRDGMEYEFDIVGDLDHENRFIVSKTRMSDLAGAVIQRPGPELGEQIHAWLTSGQSAPDLREQAVTDALARYHTAATPLIPDDRDRKDFLRYAAWKMDAAQGPATLVQSTRDIPVKTIVSITNRLPNLDSKSALGFLNEWRQEHAMSEDAVPA